MVLNKWQFSTGKIKNILNVKSQGLFCESSDSVLWFKRFGSHHLSKMLGSGQVSKIITNKKIYLQKNYSFILDKKITKILKAVSVGHTVCTHIYIFSTFPNFSVLTNIFYQPNKKVYYLCMSMSKLVNFTIKKTFFIFLLLKRKAKNRSRKAFLCQKFLFSFRNQNKENFSSTIALEWDLSVFQLTFDIFKFKFVFFHRICIHVKFFFLS